MENLVKYLHECAHFFLHRYDKTKPHHLREFEAETWALSKMRAGGLVLTDELVCKSKRRIAKAIDGARNRGIRINKQAEEFARPYLHDPKQSDFIDNVLDGIPDDPFLNLIRDGRRHSTEPNKPDYAGMTVNERLYCAGIMDQWRDAARRRDRDAMIELLKQVDVRSAAWSVDTMLANPQKYGF
jgi:hypothetical protein